MKQIESGDVDLNAPNDEGDDPHTCYCAAQEKKEGRPATESTCEWMFSSRCKQMFKVIWRHCSALGCHGVLGSLTLHVSH